MNNDLMKRLKKISSDKKIITVMTGAGISAESGIPTFRGKEGFWSVGAKEYQPEEMATYAMFSREPNEVWKWYLYRLALCTKAEPNPAHYALVTLEQALADRFTLITQNVDGLHIRAGNSYERTYQIHGNINDMRCSRECTDETYPLPEISMDRTKSTPLSKDEISKLHCPRCGERSRPHVLWFDETYNEHHYHFYSALQVSEKTDLLIITGTSGATNLPTQVASIVSRNGGFIVDINIEPNPFSNLAKSSGQGCFIQEKSSTALPALVKALISKQL